MKRRQIIRYAGAGVLAAAGAIATSGGHRAAAQAANSLTVQWLGHTCFLITGTGRRMLINPFRTAGCTAKYRSPKVPADIVLISSQLLDEGAVDVVPGNPQLLFEPGVYQFDKLRIQGIRTDHDRQGGKRFGSNIAWQWNQAGMNVLHLGGAAAPISIEQKILMGRPDVLFIPVGGGPKAYTAEEAKQTIANLNPRLIIPTHYRTRAADPKACDIESLDAFLKAMDGTRVQRSNSDAISLRSGNLPKEGSVIQVLSYRF